MNKRKQIEENITKENVNKEFCEKLEQLKSRSGGG